MRLGCAACLPCARGWFSATMPPFPGDMLVGTMPKLYEYFGLVVLFYSNEHEPIHVHGKYQGRETKAELIIVDGVVVDIRFSPVRGRLPLEGAQLRDFETLTRLYAGDIIQKWIDYFILHKQVSSVTVNRRLR